MLTPHQFAFVVQAAIRIRAADTRVAASPRDELHFAEQAFEKALALFNAAETFRKNSGLLPSAYEGD